MEEIELVAIENGFCLYGLSDESSPTSITSVVHSPAVDTRTMAFCAQFSSNNCPSKSYFYGSPIPGHVFL